MQYIKLNISLLTASLMAAPIVDPNTTTKGVDQITESGNDMIVEVNSDKAYIEWQEFNLLQNENFTVTGQSSDSILLNKVTGTLTSTIEGTINADGSVWLINPHGITLGQNAIINVFGFVASTLNITRGDFLEDNNVYNFAGSTGEVNFEGIINAGVEGYVMLAGTKVMYTGTINAKFGKVMLYSGEAVTVDFNGDGLISFASSDNTNTININNGTIDVSGDFADVTNYINTSGDHTATSITKAGDVLIFGGNVDITAGSNIQANSNDLDGGSITIEANNLYMNSSFYNNNTFEYIYEDIKLDVSSESGNAGNIQIDAAVVNIYGANWYTPAKYVFLYADSTEGNGGEILINADNAISMYASKIEAHSYNGNGGNIELNTLDYSINIGQNSSIDGKSYNGNAGQITINSGLNTEIYGDLLFGSHYGQGGRIEINANGNLLLGMEYMPTNKFDAASDHGQAGSIVLHANSYLDVWADLDASSVWGNGGYVEVGSLENNLNLYRGIIDVRSEFGDAGEINLFTTISDDFPDLGYFQQQPVHGIVHELNASSVYGNAGEISIISKYISLNGRIDLSSSSGEGGNFSAYGRDYFTSQEIDASGAYGGNIEIESNYITLYTDPLKDALNVSAIYDAGIIDLAANYVDIYNVVLNAGSDSGNGGLINIFAKNYFYSYSQNTLLDVSSNQGPGGTINLSSNVTTFSSKVLGESARIEGYERLDFLNNALTKVQKLELASNQIIGLVYDSQPFNMPVIVFDSPIISVDDYSNPKTLKINVGNEPMLIMGNPSKATTLIDNVLISLIGNQKTPIKVIYINPSDLFNGLGFTIVDHIDTNNSLADKGSLAIHHDFDEHVKIADSEDESIVNE